MKHGIYNIYKPPGPSSHDVVDVVRRLSGERRVGHAGTLDPFAEGVLIVAVGREYTKRLGEFLKLPKTYAAVIKLGASSDTGDPTGKITEQKITQRPTRKNISEVLKKFSGNISQIPPHYSAIKIKGKKAYELTRRGVKLSLAPRTVTIYALKLTAYRWPYLKIKTKVSSGTYIRSLAIDIGQALGTGAYVEKLTRTAVGKYSVAKSLKVLA